MTDNEAKQLCLELLRADYEEDVIAILRRENLWDDRNLWRLYGDKEGNYSQVGNQSSLSEAALVEKVINCIDSRLMCACLLKGIHPESDEAPKSMRDAVAVFFENKHSQSGEAGTLIDWDSKRRGEHSNFITVAATGDRSGRGRTETKNMCITIVDQGEGQSANRLPRTILSLNAKNKQRIRFVQGKFNMGGSGALRFCGDTGLQLVISRRHPGLANKERNDDPSVDKWAFTVVRREEPSNKSGEPIHSEFTYLAPMDNGVKNRKGEVLSFTSDTLPIMPESNDAYAREVEWGTAIKLYEFETKGAHVLRKGGLLAALERLMPEIALPVRLHECREGFTGHRRSFDTVLSGLVVRLEDGGGDNLEPGFPLSTQLRVSGMNMSAKIFAFKEHRADTYIKDEGVILAINGQAHGSIPKTMFNRKDVGLPRLKDSLLVLVDCSSLNVRQREDLFMTSRDRMSELQIRKSIEEGIRLLLRENSDLKRLQLERREQDTKSKLSDEKPLENVLREVFKSSPTLETLFLKGQRLAKPFDQSGGTGSESQGGEKPGKGTWTGKRHPTYFKFDRVDYGEEYKHNCELGRRCRIKFETDVENGYFDRPKEEVVFKLELSDKQMTNPDYTMNLKDGTASLNLALPVEAKEGDSISLEATVHDSVILKSFENSILLNVVKRQEHSQGSKKSRDRRQGSGSGKSKSMLGISLPKVISVRENDDQWKRHNFDNDTACHVISEADGDGGDIEHVFYINMSNTSLLTEMKYLKKRSRSQENSHSLLEAKFKYGNVLLGLAMLHTKNEDDNGEGEDTTIQEKIRIFTAAVAPVLIPMINQLSGLNEEDIEAFDASSEDSEIQSDE